MSALHHDDPLNYVNKLENGCSDPEMKDNIQTLGLLISILRPFLKFSYEWHIKHEEMDVRLKHMADVVQKVSWAFEPRPLPGLLKQADNASTRNAKLFATNLEILRSLKEDMVQIVSLRTIHTSFPYVIYVTGDEVKHVARFINSLSQNLKDVSSICGDNIISRVKKELADVEEWLKFLASFLWLVAKPFILLNTSKDVAKRAQILAVKFSYNLFICFVDDKLVADDHMKEDIFQDVLTKIGTLMLELKKIYDGSRFLRNPDCYPTIDEHLLGFFDHLIHKLRKQLNNKASFMIATAKVQIDILLEELRFIKGSNLMDMLLANSIDKLESLRISMQALIIDTGFFIYFSRDKEGGEKLMVNYLSFGLPDLLEAVDTVHQQARNMFHKYVPQSRQCNFSSTDEMEIVYFLVINKLEELLNSKAPSIDPLKCQIIILHDEMFNLRKCFCEMAELMGYSQMEFHLTRFKLAAYQAEYVVDSLMTGEGPLWLHKLGIFVITQDIKIMQKEVKIILKTNLDSDVHSISKAFTSTQIYGGSSINAPISSKDEMQIKIEEDANQLVGMKDVVAEIIGLLTERSRQLKIISIVGMPGLGKTTLANSVFKHPSVHVTFHVRAWCCLSQFYQKETLLSSILGQICQEETNQSHDISGEDFAQKLYKSLKGRKYLIVIDDIWDIEAWVDLRDCFPDDENGSRILFTTRIHDLAVKANSFSYALRLLSSKESCELLWLKLFNGETCPRELLSISKRIACSCKGLPLAVVLIAGTLNRTTKDSWEKVAKTLITSHSIQEQIMDILEVSYKHLPNHLKPCFSYFGMFPEGKTILASKLICLWISEGFVKQPYFDQKSLKQEAESYLNDLIDRSLVMITKKSSRGEVKACCVHDVLREFCLSKLEKERFVMREHISSGISVLYGDLKKHKPYLINFLTTKEPHIRSLLYYYQSHINKDSRCREDLSEQKEIMNWPPGNRATLSDHPEFRTSFSTDRSCFTEPVPGTRTSQLRQLDYGSILKYEYLRVLDLGNVGIQSGANTSDLVKIAELVHLRYLALRVRVAEIPSEISNLRNLETFIISGAVGKVILPEAIWELVSLRHVKMEPSFFSFQHYSQEFFENPSQLDNLKSISTLYMWHGNIEKFMRRLPRVQKLGCIFSNSWQDYYEACNLFKVLEFLCELRSLKMSFHARAPYPFKFSFPSSLEKLAISNARLSWNEISVLGQLPNLEVLKLTNRAFEGQLWDMREGEFQKLKFLKLDSLDIVLWNASSEHLPRLEQLLVLRCQQLEEIPSSFGEIATLQLIEMKWCSPSASDSVKQILEDQRDLSNDQFNVIVDPQPDLA